jgi:hypothetical protein
MAYIQTIVGLQISFMILTFKALKNYSYVDINNVVQIPWPWYSIYITTNFVKNKSNNLTLVQSNRGLPLWATNANANALSGAMKALPTLGKNGTT